METSNMDNLENQVFIQGQEEQTFTNLSDIQEEEQAHLKGIFETESESNATADEKLRRLKSREERGTWKHPLDFLFSCVSMMVGLGNVWRFPYLCYKNGGGVFLIIYLITTVFCGLPIVFQEVIVGQYFGEGGGTIIGKLCPILKGVGMSTMTMVCYYNIYYCIIISWSLYYFIASFVSIPDLPWNTCKGWWNSKNCWLPSEMTNSTYMENGKLDEIKNVLSTVNATNVTNPKVAAVIEFWEDRVLQINNGIEFGLGSIQWELAGTLLLGWVIVYIIVCRGLHQSGYVVWITAVSPYIIMGILMVRALTLEGSMTGLKAYVNIDWKYFKQGRTWLDASTQIFFDYSIGHGALAAMGSYNKFNHNCIRDAFLACMVCTFTCLSAGLLVFATLGNMAHLQNKTVDEIATSGPGLVFLAYPELVLSLPASFVWSILFFLMLLILGIDTEFCCVESLVTFISDKWSNQLRSRRRLVAAGVCVTCYILGLPMIFEGGMYLFQIVDFYAASGMSLLWVCFFQNIAISWFYGTDKLEAHVQEMIEGSNGRTWKFFMFLLTTCWKTFCPFVILGIFISYIYSYSPVTYGETYNYPKWAEILGLMISFSSMMWVPIYAIHYSISGYFEESNTGANMYQKLCKSVSMGLNPVFEQDQVFSELHQKQENKEPQEDQKSDNTM